MSIVVRLPEPLRRGGANSITIDEPVETVGDLSRILEARVRGFSLAEDALYNVAVNGEMILHGERERRLEDGDEVEILVAFAGG